MSGRAPSPISPEGLREAVIERALALRTNAVVLVDGADATRPGELAAAVTNALRSAGRPAEHVETRYFWRDASVRLEYGREDVDSYLDWLDVAALEREVIRPLRSGRPVLTSLRDPVTNRATRAEPVELADGTVIISGEFLLRHDLEADLIVHLSASAAALARRTPAEASWTLPALARYEIESTPTLRSDVVVRCDDPKHPAALGLR